MSLLFEKVKTEIIKLWNEFLILMEYLIRAPFIELAGLWAFLNKSSFNGSALIFYALNIFIAIQLKTKPITKIDLIFYSLAILIAFIWFMSSLPDYKQYYLKKYFGKKYEKP